MKRNIGTLDHRRLIIAGAMLLMLVVPLSATIRTVQFGDSFGFAYSPSSMSVAVGDTIKWTGDFVTHPLSSSTIPIGASGFTCTSGTVFIYVVQFSGTYNYFCTEHVGIGMLGSFSAVLSGVDADQHSSTPASFVLGQNYPNPFNPTTGIRYQVPGISGKLPVVSLKVYDLLGNEVATLVSERKSPGAYEVRFDAAKLSSGVYFYRLQAEGVSLTKRLILLR